MRVKRSVWAVLGVLGLVLAVGCGDPEAPSRDQDQVEAEPLTVADGKEDGLSSTSTYFSMRRDLRKCMAPYCGGYWVKRVNRTSTRCHDGTYAEECYVAELDLAPLGLSAAEQTKLDGELGAGRALARGRVESHAYTVGSSAPRLGRFKASEGWQALGTAAPTGFFRRMTDNGIRCVKAPCFSLHGPRLNSTLWMDFSGLDLAAAGITTKQLQLVGEALLTRDGAIVVGKAVAAPGGGIAMTGSQVYLRLKKSAPSDLACAKDSDCTWTAFAKAVSSASECYCTVCPTTILNVTTAQANQASWDQACAGVRLMCPLYPCHLQPAPICRNGLCVAP